MSSGIHCVRHMMKTLYNANGFLMLLAPRIHKRLYPMQKSHFCDKILIFHQKVYSGCRNALLDENMTFGWQCDFLWIHGARNIKKPLVLCSVSGHCPTKYGLSFKGCFLREKCHLCTKCDFWSENCILS